MKKYLLPVLFFSVILLPAMAQHPATGKKKSIQLPLSQKMISFNPFSLFEPQAAIGIGFDHIVTQQWGYFTELSYVFKTPFYKNPDPITGGFRWLVQYRYYLKAGGGWDYFIAPEFRMKGYGFTGSRNFENLQTADTLANVPYKANALSVGGGLLAGTGFNLTKNGQWRGEISAGIGARHKFVRYKNLPQGYKPVVYENACGFCPPQFDKAIGMPYFPMALRIKYRLP